ncbi:MAG: hypothetical protein Fur0037_22050 [Planctomycetota bacterium]
MDRLKDRHPLKRGAHPTRDDGMCAMETVAWLAGEEHSDEPRCACPVIAAFVRAFNDALPSDSARSRYLRAFVPRIVNSRGTLEHERRRGWLCADAVVRGLVPMALFRSGRRAEAGLLQELPVIRGAATARAALRALATYAPDQDAARWILERAIEGTPAARFAAGVVHVARGVGDVASFTLLAELLRAMLALDARAGKTSPDLPR